MLIFKMGQGAYCILFCLHRLSMLPFCITTTLLLLIYQTNKTWNRWRSVDARCQDGAGSVLLALLPIKDGNTSITCIHYQIVFVLPDLQDQKLLKLRWHSVSRWGREHHAFFLAYNGWQHFHYVYSLPNRVCITQLTGPKIVEAPLTLIFKMGQGASRFLSCL